MWFFAWKPQGMTPPHSSPPRFPLFSLCLHFNMLLFAFNDLHSLHRVRLLPCVQIEAPSHLQTGQPVTQQTPKHSLAHSLHRVRILPCGEIEAPPHLQTGQPVTQQTRKHSLAHSLHRLRLLPCGVKDNSVIWVTLAAKRFRSSKALLECN